MNSGLSTKWSTLWIDKQKDFCDSAEVQCGRARVPLLKSEYLQEEGREISTKCLCELLT